MVWGRCRKRLIHICLFWGIGYRKWFEICFRMGYACNLKCSYCYQSLIKSSSRCTKIEADEIIKFILAVAEDNNFEVYDICFIGGEPLIYFEDMIKISSELNTQLCSKNCQ